MAPRRPRRRVPERASAGAGARGGMEMRVKAGFEEKGVDTA